MLQVVTTGAYYPLVATTGAYFAQNGEIRVWVYLFVMEQWRRVGFLPLYNTVYRVNSEFRIKINQNCYHDFD